MIRFVPEHMETVFRNPELYHAILRAVAIGNTRNSQIAARIGEPNNKCDKYCQVLINHNILENQNHNYRFVNSYFELWYAVFYGSPRGLYREESKTELVEDVVKKVDEITTRRFLDAVHREIDVAKGEKSLRPSTADIHFSNGNTYHFDQIVQGSTRCKFVKILPPGSPAFDLHELDELCDAVSTITEPYNTDIFIYSWLPFSERIRKYEENVYFLHLISADELL